MRNQPTRTRTRSFRLFLLPRTTPASQCQFASCLAPPSDEHTLQLGYAPLPAAVSRALVSSSSSSCQRLLPLNRSRPAPAPAPLAANLGPAFVFDIVGLRPDAPAQRSNSPSPQDGVLKQGEKVLPQARAALHILSGNNHLKKKYPFILVTNGGTRASLLALQGLRR